MVGYKMSYNIFLRVDTVTKEAIEKLLDDLGREYFIVVSIPEYTDCKKAKRAEQAATTALPSPRIPPDAEERN